MKIIDLLNKIAKGEEVPKKIKYNGVIYNKDNDGDIDYYFGEDFNSRLLLGKLIDTNELRDIVEIIEEEKEIEKKIEKIIISMDDTSMPYVTNNKYQKLSYSEVDLLFVSKINELIDVINDMRDKEC